MSGMFKSSTLSGYLPNGPAALFSGMKKKKIQKCDRSVHHFQKKQNITFISKARMSPHFKEYSEI